MKDLYSEPAFPCFPTEWSWLDCIVYWDCQTPSKMAAEISPHSIVKSWLKYLRANFKSTSTFLCRLFLQNWGQSQVCTKKLYILRICSELDRTSVEFCRKDAPLLSLCLCPSLLFSNKLSLFFPLPFLCQPTNTLFISFYLANYPVSFVPFFSLSSLPPFSYQPWRL